MQAGGYSRNGFSATKPRKNRQPKGARKFYSPDEISRIKLTTLGSWYDQKKLLRDQKICVMIVIMKMLMRTSQMKNNYATPMKKNFYA